MNKHKLVLLSAMFLLAGITSGCCFWPFCSDGGSQPQSGFYAEGRAYVQVVGGGFFYQNPTNVQGTWLFDNGNAVGNTKSFAPMCCGSRFVTDGRVPARWQIVAGAGECIGQLTNPNVDVVANASITAKCLKPGIIFSFVVSPGEVNLQAPPATIEMSGSGLATTYGMPRIEYRDSYTGALIAVSTATEVSPDGTSLTMVTPDLSSVYSGTYDVFISNALADGSFETVGGATVDAYGRDNVFDPPPPPGDCGCPPDGGPCLECDLTIASVPPDRNRTILLLGRFLH